MRASILLTALASLTLGVAQSTSAPVVTNEPAGVGFIATLPNLNTTTIRGSITGTSNTNGTGVVFTVSFSGFPSAGGPFLYHIHDQPVPANGNCAATLGHLDPYNRGETPACDASQPQTCQVGDLSGKYGMISGPSYSATYLDPYTSTLAGTPAYFGNRSVVVHFNNLTRITCANFMPLSNGTMSSCSSTASAAPTAASTNPSAPATYTNAAAKLGGSLAGIAAAAIGLMAL